MLSVWLDDDEDDNSYEIRIKTQPKILVFLLFLAEHYFKKMDIIKYYFLLNSTALKNF